MIVKHRPEAGVIDRMDLIGTVDGKDIVIIDDMIDTAGTLCKAAKTLKEMGARKIFAFASHGLFNDPAMQVISESCIDQIIVTNSIPLSPKLQEAFSQNKKIAQVSCGPLIADAIRRIH